eukprot:364354-Chlamydomonas_euryale.AAC.13
MWGTGGGHNACRRLVRCAGMIRFGPQHASSPHRMSMLHPPTFARKGSCTTGEGGASSEQQAGGVVELHRLTSWVASASAGDAARARSPPALKAARPLGLVAGTAGAGREEGVSTHVDVGTSMGDVRGEVGCDCQLSSAGNAPGVSGGLALPPPPPVPPMPLPPGQGAEMRACSSAGEAAAPAPAAAALQSRAQTVLPRHRCPGAAAVAGAAARQPSVAALARRGISQQHEAEQRRLMGAAEGGAAAGAACAERSLAIAHRRRQAIGRGVVRALRGRARSIGCFRGRILLSVLRPAAAAAAVATAARTGRIAAVTGEPSGDAVGLSQGLWPQRQDTSGVTTGAACSIVATPGAETRCGGARVARASGRATAPGMKTNGDSLSPAGRRACLRKVSRKSISPASRNSPSSEPRAPAAAPAGDSTHAPLALLIIPRTTSDAIPPSLLRPSCPPPCSVCLRSVTPGSRQEEADGATSVVAGAGGFRSPGPNATGTQLPSLGSVHDGPKPTSVRHADDKSRGQIQPVRGLPVRARVAHSSMRRGARCRMRATRRRVRQIARHVVANCWHSWLVAARYTPEEAGHTGIV